MVEGQRLYHVSEEAGIAVFEPRLPASTDSRVRDEVAWAIDEEHLPNYLLPRDCPRVTFGVSAHTTDENRGAYFGGSIGRRVVAIESAWRQRIRICRLFVYEMPPQEFQLVDRSAGYWVARKPVVPTAVTEVADCLTEIRKLGAEVRICDELWPLYDVVLCSTLDYSIIRMRNARPRSQS
jgi:hypothetical protein